MPEDGVVGAVLAAAVDGCAEYDLPGPGLDPVPVEKRLQQWNQVLLLDAAGPLQDELPVTSIVLVRARRTVPSPRFQTAVNVFEMDKAFLR